MSDNINNQLKNKVTVQDLEDSSYNGRNNKIDFSAFSTAVRKQKFQKTFDKTYDHTRYEKNSLPPNSIQKYKSSLDSYQKQFKQRLKFKQTKLLTPNFDKEAFKESKQKQNNNNYLNSLHKIQQHNADIDSHQSSSLRNDLQWASASKNQTAGIVRKLFGTSAKDYNFQYRKKKFFQNFKRIQ